ncbi:MAG: dihydrolipoyl dehydrogenase [Rhodanobacter sp.]
MSMREVEIAIIGAGTAGMSAYRQVRKHTDSIALIEAGPFGTTCARVGCMPSKLLIAAADARHQLTTLAEFGIASDAGKVDGRAVMKRVRDERDRFVGFVLDAVAGFDTRHVVHAQAAFVDAHTLELAPGRDGSVPEVERIRARRIIIATGSRPTIPEALRVAGDRLIISDDVFDWQDLPASIAVFGAGLIGLELGQALHRLGVRVHLFGRGGRLAGISDPKVHAVATRLMAAELPLSLEVADVRVERDGDAVIVHFADPGSAPTNERFDYLLAATGRTPNIEALRLEHSGLELDAKGLPVFDPQTTQAGDSHIFIAGDADADRVLLHEAVDDGYLAGQQAARYPAVYKHARRTPLGIVFSDPQVAYAGQRHAQLLSAGTDFAAGEVSFENQGRSRVLLVNRGLLRVYGEQGSGMLLGAEMIGPQNEHLAHLLAWAIQSRMTVSDVLKMPFYHPTIEEGLRTALRDLLKALGMAAAPPRNCLDCGPGG